MALREQKERNYEKEVAREKQAERISHVGDIVAYSFLLRFHLSPRVT